MYLIKVHVQLPDGSFAYCRVAKWHGNNRVVIKEETEKDAYEWAKYILPDRVRIETE